MTKEYLLYSSIYRYSVASLISFLEAEKGKDIVIRVNSEGGSVEDAYGMIAKMKEHKGSISIKVDGRAYSMAAFLLAFSKDVEALDVSEIIIHRAAYPSFIEQSKDWMTEDMWNSLNRVNATLRQALESRINVETFTQLKGVTLDQVFSNDSRIDVTLTAQEAKEIGLIDRIVTITPQKRAELESNYRIAAQANPQAPLVRLPISAEQTTTIQTPNMEKLTLAELKAKYPDVYAEAVKEGVKQERTRAAAFLVYNDVDPEGVKKAIKEGNEMDAEALAEFARKAMSKSALEAAQADSSTEVTTTETETTQPSAEAKQAEDFKKEVMSAIKGSK